MLQLTEYQDQALESLRLYLQECDRSKDADAAFYEMTRLVWGRGIAYTPVALPDLAQIPYVCLRLPTGGGKTLLACHTIAAANQAYLKQEHSVVLWLVPSNAIREQTLKALRDRNYAYRQALDSTLGAVAVLDVEEALSVQKNVLSGNTTIILATLQAFRVEEKEGRRVYASAGALQHHFDNLPGEVAGKLLREDSGVLPCSLANVLRMHRPLVIVDEAHNARTELSFETLANFRPSAIIEFTATPASRKNPSNVLLSVSAAQLKAESMIKLPIRLETKSDWRTVLTDAIAQRDDLEKRAQLEFQKTGEYIRPVLLLQGQPRRQHQDTLNVDVLRQTLVEDCRVPENQVAVVTGERTDIEKDVDLFSPKCEVRYIITVQALAEGWDCPFAYVLCSVRELRSSGAVEQILGRVLRLPLRQRKADEALNRAYAFVTSRNFAEAAQTLVDALVENGFNQQEAREFIRFELPTQPDLGLDQGSSRVPPKTIRLTEVPATAALPASLREKLEVDPVQRTVTIKAYLLPEEEEAFRKELVMFDAQEAWTLEVRRHRQESEDIFRSPSEKSLPFAVPQLCIRVGEQLELFEDQHLLDYGWELAGFDARLTEAEYGELSRELGDTGEIDIAPSGEVRSRFIPELNRELQLIEAVDENWTVGQLVHWLGRNLVYHELVPADKERFLIALVGDLLDRRGLSLAQAVRKRFDLRKAVERRINDCRTQAKGKAYQELLFGGEPPEVLVTPERCFFYKPDEYPMRSVCPASSLFKRHYYPKVGELDSKGEEFECAVYVDQMAEVEYWVRNLDRQPAFSFWLQTASDKFYPDFVCRLKDGRYLVVEYKGEHLWSNEDSREKRRLGELWEAKSGGRCLFAMPKGPRLEEIRARVRVR